MHPAALTLLYREMPSVLAPDELQFCLFSESAAREAIAAHQATSWGQFAEAVGMPFDRLADTDGDWGEEVAEAFGRASKAGDPFRMRRCRWKGAGVGSGAGVGKQSWKLPPTGAHLLNR